MKTKVSRIIMMKISKKLKKPPPILRQRSNPSLLPLLLISEIAIAISYHILKQRGGEIEFYACFAFCITV